MQTHLKLIELLFISQAVDSEAQDSTVGEQMTVVLLNT